MNILKNIAIIVLLFFSCVILCSCGVNSHNREVIINEELFLFDTYVSITSEITEDNGTAALLKELDSEFSEVYEKNANEITGKDIIECAELCREWNERFEYLFGKSVNYTCGALTQLWGISGGAPHVPDGKELAAAVSTITDENIPFSLMPEGTRLDFGASAKGYACDRVKALLDEVGTGFEVVSLGSSTLLYGEKSDGSPFRAAVKNPDSPSDYLGVIRTGAAFISTSGGYERFFEANGVKYEHILSPETGMPVETDLVSVTVIASAGTENGGIYTDLLATALYIGGTETLKEFLSEETGFEIVAADYENNVYVSRGVDFTLYEKSGFRLKTDI